MRPPYFRLYIYDPGAGWRVENTRSVHTACKCAIEARAAGARTVLVRHYENKSAWAAGLGAIGEWRYPLNCERLPPAYM